MAEINGPKTPKHPDRHRMTPANPNKNTKQIVGTQHKNAANLVEGCPSCELGTMEPDNPRLSTSSLMHAFYQGVHGEKLFTWQRVHMSLPQMQVL